MKTKTFLVGLATVLLARATDRKVDPLTLQAYADVSPGLRAYSARGLAHSVLVPAARNAGLDLGLYGDEPLQNNPFTDEPRLHRKLRARYPEELDELVAACERVRELSPPDAMAALAGYARVRLAVEGATQMALPSGTVQFGDVLDVVEQFVKGRSERGRVGQAVVAAALDVVFEDVKTRNVFASSSTRPGDVRVEDPAGISLAVEVRQKVVEPTMVANFARSLSQAGIPRGMYVAIAPKQPPLASSEITRLSARSGLVFECYSNVADFLVSVALLAPSKQVFLIRFPRRFLDRLAELGASSEAQSQFSGLLAGRDVQGQVGSGRAAGR